MFKSFKFWEKEEISIEHQLSEAVRAYVDMGFSRKLINVQVKNIFFDYNYKEYSTEKSTPSQQLTAYFKMAKQGDKSFLREQLYRALRRDGDAYAKTLTHTLKRNE